jgi:ABC-type glycerol-3-phosphate transport system substrate-binding protein
MKKTWHVMTSLILAIMVMACSKASEAASTAVKPGTVDFTQHETFTLWEQSDFNDYYSDYSDNPVMRYVGNKFNTTLKFEQPVSGGEADSLSLMFGTGEYTDMVNLTTYTGSLQELYEDGAIIDIAQYLDYMPNFKKLLDSNEAYRKNVYTDDGKILSFRPITTVSELIWGGLMYRRDILETTKMKPPVWNHEPVPAGALKPCNAALVSG